MQMELEVGNFGFLGVWKTGAIEEEPLRAATSQQRTQPKYEDELGDHTCATLAGGEGNYHFT